MKNNEAVKLALQKTNKFNAYTTENLKAMLGICPQEIRAAINSLRCSGYPICVNPNGYYWERSRKSVLAYADNLELKAKGIMRAVAGLRKTKLK